MRRLAPTAFVWLALAAAATPAAAVTPVIQASPGQTVVIPTSTGWGGHRRRVRAGQYLKRISEYEKVMVDKADSKYATDPDFRANVDHLSALQFGGRTYAQLTPDERATIASQVQPQSGALEVLLRWVRDAGKSATHVTFGK
jgi:hypothetical protein